MPAPGPPPSVIVPPPARAPLVIVPPAPLIPPPAMAPPARAPPNAGIGRVSRHSARRLMTPATWRPKTMRTAPPSWRRTVSYTHLDAADDLTRVDLGARRI